MRGFSRYTSEVRHRRLTAESCAGKSSSALRAKAKTASSAIVHAPRAKAKGSASNKLGEQRQNLRLAQLLTLSRPHGHDEMAVSRPTRCTTPKSLNRMILTIGMPGPTLQNLAQNLLGSFPREPMPFQSTFTVGHVERDGVRVNYPARTKNPVNIYCSPSGGRWVETCDAVTGLILPEVTACVHQDPRASRSHAYLGRPNLLPLAKCDCDACPSQGPKQIVSM